MFQLVFKGERADAAGGSGSALPCPAWRPRASGADSRLEKRLPILILLSPRFARGALVRASSKRAMGAGAAGGGRRLAAGASTKKRLQLPDGCFFAAKRLRGPARAVSERSGAGGGGFRKSRRACGPTVRATGPSSSWCCSPSPSRLRMGGLELMAFPWAVADSQWCRFSVRFDKRMKKIAGAGGSGERSATSTRWCTRRCGRAA